MYERIRALWPQAARFVVVGTLTTAVDFAVLNSLLILTGTADDAQGFPLYATIAFVVATVHSFLWNHYWTFRTPSDEQAHQSTRRTLPRFYLVTITSFAINVGLSSLLVWLAPFPQISTHVWINIAKLLSTSVSLVSNFVGYKWFVFRAR